MKFSQLAHADYCPGIWYQLCYISLKNVWYWNIGYILLWHVQRVQHLRELFWGKEWTLSIWRDEWIPQLGLPLSFKSSCNFECKLNIKIPVDISRWVAGLPRSNICEIVRANGSYKMKSNILCLFISIRCTVGHGQEMRVCSLQSII